MMVRTDGDSLIFADKVKLPARPMVGVLGTAPAEGTVYTAHPGAQGSNMDFNANTIGTTVYLPVHVPGALLASAICTPRWAMAKSAAPVWRSAARRSPGSS